eukprot:TRINITY_DN78552_c0_g1_i1.p1 TRINITY_DN78552_c0_g1~~TRINITY_DN78552_c0_g1_i1.p1  ORF type:complete len:215 (+),score=46.60 TRINITY_DN78552_c0_g1_i1:36-647(+)
MAIVEGRLLDPEERASCLDPENMETEKTTEKDQQLISVQPRGKVFRFVALTCVALVVAVAVCLVVGTPQQSLVHGNAYVQLPYYDATLGAVNEIYLADEDYQDEEEYPNLESTLRSLQRDFVGFDGDKSGDIDLMELKLMMEKIGQPKTHLELKKMIAEVDREDRGAISYNDFLLMSLGKTKSVLKLMLPKRGQPTAKRGFLP